MSQATHDLLTFDLHEDLITLPQAAELAAVSVPVVRNWIKRGYQAPDGTVTKLPAQKGLDGWWLVKGIDVLKAEAATRRRAGRRIAAHG